MAGAHLAQRSRVDADPPIAGVQQRSPGLLGAGQLGCRDRRRTSSSAAAVKVHCTIASRLKPADRSLGDGDARPRTATVARTRCSGPISSMPARSSSAGAWSRNSSAASTSSSTAAGWSSSASGASTSTLAATVVASSWTVEARRGRCCGLVGHLDGEGIARPHIGGAAPPPRIGLVDELQVDPPRVEAIVGDDEAKASDQHRFATGPGGRGAGGSPKRDRAHRRARRGWPGRGRPGR